MDACKAAVKALRNSPAAVRRKISSTSSSRMHKLKDDWLNEPDALVAGITFFVKFLGYVETSSVSGQSCADHAVRLISTSAKQQKEKLEKISICVSAKSIKLATLNSEVKILEFPIYKVTFCTVDSRNDKIVSFIAQSPDTASIACYAFLCNSKSKAWAITLSLAQAFDIAFEQWEKRKQRRTEQRLALERARRGSMKELDSDDEHQRSRSLDLDSSCRSIDEAILELDVRSQSMSENCFKRHGVVNGGGKNHLSSNSLRSGSDSALSDDELDTEFTRLALSRSTPNLLDTGLTKTPTVLDERFEDNSRENLEEFRNGEDNPAVLYRMVSREDLLDI